MDGTLQAPTQPCRSNHERRYGKTARSVGDSKDIFHETLWTIFSHVERSGSTGIATLVESDGPVSGRPHSF